MKPYLYSLDGLSDEAKKEYAPVDFDQLGEAEQKRFSGIKKEGETLYLLTVEASEGWELGNLRGLKSGLEDERASASKFEKEAKALAAERDKLKEQVNSKQKSTNDDVAKAQLEELAAQHAAKVEELNKTIESTEADLHGVLVVKEAQEALASGGFSKASKLMLDHVTKHMRVGRDAETGERITEIFDPTRSGLPRRVGVDGQAWLDAKGFVAELKASPDYADFADGSKHSGADLEGGSSRTVPSTNKPDSSQSPTSVLAQHWGNSA